MPSPVTTPRGLRARRLRGGQAFLWWVGLLVLFSALSFGLVIDSLRRHGRSNQQHAERLVQRIRKPGSGDNTQAERLAALLVEDFPGWLQMGHLQLPFCTPLTVMQRPTSSAQQHRSYSDTCSPASSDAAPVEGSAGRGSRNMYKGSEVNARAFMQVREPTKVASNAREHPLDSNSYEGLISFIGKRESEEIQRQQRENSVFQGVSDICRPLKEAKVLIGLYGPPGSGKTTVTFLSALYGFRAKDLEDLVIYDNDKSKWRMPKGLSANGELSKLLRSISHKSPTSFMLAMGPQGGMLKDPGKSPDQVPLEMFRVMLIPSKATYTARWKARNPNDRQRNEEVYRRMLDEADERADLVIQNDECPLSGLVDLCRGFLAFVSLASHENKTRHISTEITGVAEENTKAHLPGRSRRLKLLKHYCSNAKKSSSFGTLFCEENTHANHSILAQHTYDHLSRSEYPVECPTKRTGNKAEKMVDRSKSTQISQNDNMTGEKSLQDLPADETALIAAFNSISFPAKLPDVACPETFDEGVKRVVPGSINRNVTKTKLGLLSLPQFVRSYNHKHQKYIEEMRGESRPLSPSISAACSALNTSGVVVMVAGPPGAGKSAIAASAIYHGMHAVETEATTRHAECLEKEECTPSSIRSILEASTIFSPRMTVLAGGGLATIPFSDKTEFYATDLERRFGPMMKHLFPENVIRVLILPSTYCTGKECEFPEDSARAGSQKGHHTPNQRKMAYKIAVHPSFKKAFDVVISNDGACAEAGLVEVCLGVQSFLKGSSERAVVAHHFYNQKYSKALRVKQHAVMHRGKIAFPRSCEDKSSVDALLGCSKQDQMARDSLIALVQQRAVNNQVLVLFSNFDFVPVLINWLALYASFSNEDNYIIISLDSKCHEVLSKKNLPSISIPEDVAKRYITGHSNHILKAKFWGMMTILRYSTVNILYSDTDAVWTRDIQEYIREEEAVHKADILSQRGRHPTIVSKEWGCAFNTGILFLRNSHRMDKFFEEVWKITNRKDQHDDQSAMNHALYERTVQWEEDLPLKYTGPDTHVSYGSSRSGDQRLRVGLLPNFLFQRRCENGTRTDVAFVLHCHAVRTNLAKTDTIDQQGMYVLRSDWEEIDGPLDETPGTFLVVVPDPKLVVDDAKVYYRGIMAWRTGSKERGEAIMP